MSIWTFRLKQNNSASSRVVSDVTRIATDNRYILFETSSGATIAYGMLRYESGMRLDFESETELWNAAHEAGYSGSHGLQKIDDLYSAYYDWSKMFVEQPSIGQPATRPKDGEEGSDKPYAEAKGCSESQ